MSTLPTQRQAQAAYAFMLHEIFVPSMLEKLAADHGIRPKNEQELEQLLKLGALLMAAEAGGQLKTAEAESDSGGNEFLDDAIQNVETLLRGSPSSEEIVKQAAAAMAKNDRVKTAALIWRHLVEGGETQPEEPAEQAGETDQAA